MVEIEGFENIENEIKSNLNSGKDVLMFAFNATGKTRLSKTFDSGLGKESLCYNAYIEDSFTWDNEEKILKFADAELLGFISENGLDGQIVNVFKACIGTKLEPFIHFEKNNISNIEFKMATGDDESRDNVKISKGEESLFKWAVYLVLVDYGLHSYDEESEEFKNLKYIVIDDPITSLDDYRICIVASQILDLMKYARIKKLPIRFLITTHHQMFYNILRNSMNSDIELRGEKNAFYKMEKSDNEIKCVLKPWNNTLVYHLDELRMIRQAIQRSSITKNLFNIMRSVLEKMAVILGYGHWNELISDLNPNDKVKYEMYVNALNMNSHNQYSDIDTDNVPDDQKQIFIDGFEFFINKYKIKL